MSYPTGMTPIDQELFASSSARRDSFARGQSCLDELFLKSDESFLKSDELFFKSDDLFLKSDELFVYLIKQLCARAGLAHMREADT